jgi:hypothetical protein
MRHARKDYERFQDPALGNDEVAAKFGVENPIGEDEPVFLIRGTDRFAPMVIREWGKIAVAHGQKEIGVRAKAWADHVERWQKENGSKLPDMPEGEDGLGYL